MSTTGRVAMRPKTSKTDVGPTHKTAGGSSSSVLMLDRTPSSINSKRHLLELDSRARLKHLATVTLLLIGLIICVSSLVCLLLLPSFITSQISKRLVLKNNSMLLERWSKPNVPMYFKVWVFDVTNAHELAAKRDTRAHVKEIGPFVFHLKRQKDIVSFAGDNLYYTERKIYRFSPELSCCAINTTVTIPNIPLVAVVDRALGYNLPLVGRFIPRLINRAIQSLREQLFVRKQVREILFDGYDVELLKMVSRVGAIVGLPQTNQKFGLLKGRNDTWRPEQDGVWAINTGASDRRQFGKVSSWNSYKNLPFWAAPGCNAINGSDGTLFPPPIKTSEPLYIFNQELCRTVNLVYDRPSDIRGIKALKFVLNPMNFAHTVTGAQPSTATTTARLKATASANASPVAKLDAAANEILKASAATRSREVSAVAPGVAEFKAHDEASALANGKRWRLGGQQPPPSVSASGLGPPATRAEQERFVLAAQEAQARTEQRPSQRNPFTCFCDRKTTNLNGINVCEFDGLIDLSKCTKQAQVIFGSMPHFYRSDARLTRQVVGLEPNASKHTTYLDIEPNTGLVLGGKRRVQLNLLMKHNNEVDGFENINDMLVPLVWFEESAMIPEESAQKFKSLYTNRIRAINIVLISMLLASMGLIAIDLRLLLASGHWHQFRLVKLAAAGCQQATSGKTSASNSYSSSGRGDGDSGESDSCVATCAGDLDPNERLRSSISDNNLGRRKGSSDSTGSASSGHGLTADLGGNDEVTSGKNTPSEISSGVGASSRATSASGPTMDSPLLATHGFSSSRATNLASRLLRRSNAFDHDLDNGISQESRVAVDWRQRNKTVIDINREPSEGVANLTAE